MAEEDHHVAVAVVPKFDMPRHQSNLSSNDVKSLVKRYEIPLDLHPGVPSEWHTMDQLPEDAIGLFDRFIEFSGIRVPFSTLLLALKHGHWYSFEKRVGKGAGGKIFCETFFGMKGWKDKFFFIDRRGILDAMAWRHHDSDVNDPFLDDDYSILDVRALAEKVIDLRPVHPGLLFTASRATTWDFSSFYPVFKDSRGSGYIITLLMYMRVGAAISAKEETTQHTTPPHPVHQSISDKTASQLEVEVEDPKVFTAKEKKKGTIQLKENLTLSP
ncbi:hypothetical protein Tco_0750033 [Tanacetum coccineum]|uniref:Uncharacterized protein n=1 Tax=Tanacetum coccineum TaxID=301880 RepID=A0ABQ4Z0X0_9ASTR